MRQTHSIRIGGAILAAGALLALSACSSSATTGGGSPTSSAAGPKAELADIPNTGVMVTPVVSDGEVAIDVGGGTTVTLEEGAELSLATFLTGFGNSYDLAQIKAVDDAAAKYGLSIEKFNPNGNPQTQRNQLETAIASKKYNLIYVSPIDDSLCPLVQEAAAQNILVAAAGTPLCGLGDAVNDDLTADGTLTFVGGVSARDGYFEIAQDVVERNDSAKAIIISGPAETNPTKQVKEAFDAATEGTDFEVLATGYGDYTKQGGYETMQNLLVANPDVNLVWTNYSEMTLGALQAIKEAGRTDITLWDDGGTEGIVEAMKAGEIAATVAQYPYSAAYSTVAALATAAAGNEVPRVMLNDGAELLPGSAAGTTVNFIMAEDVAEYTPEY